MSSEFDSHADIPFQIKTEGNKITVRWQPGVPTKSTPGVANSAQGTISWNIPSPARGCNTVADGTSAYCGAIVVVSTSPLTTSNHPVDGTVYDSPDPTVDPTAHAGNKIGGALVVGSFYEGEKKANGESLTVSMVVNDVDSKTPYYIGVFAVDCQFRYHTKGVYAYSLPYGDDAEDDSPSYQIIQLGSGVALTDATPTSVCQAGIGSPPTYPTLYVDILATDTYPKGVTEDQVIHIAIEGACTYGDLIDQMNDQIVQWTIDNSSSPSGSDSDPPNTGQYAYVDGVLKRFDGTQYVDVSNAFFEATDPSVVNIGDYWWDPETEELKRDRLPNPTPAGSPDPNGWNDINTTIYLQDPTQLTDCDDFWISGTQGYRWCGTTWCELPTYVQTTDPLAVDLTSTVYWFDSINEVLKKWNVLTNEWVTITAIMWGVAPTALDVGTYWINDGGSPQTLQQWNGSVWSASIAMTISETEPTTTIALMFWYDPSTETLYQRNVGNTAWTTPDALIWAEDPTNPSSCDAWWDIGSPEQLNLWDSVHSEWDTVQNFYIQGTNPLTPPSLVADTLWYNPTSTVLKQWTGGDWTTVTLIKAGSDPTIPVDGDAWYNPSSNSWYVWGSGQWTEIDPIDSIFDPKSFPTDGEIWYDTANDLLYLRVSGAWMLEPYVTNVKGNTIGTLWLNPNDNTLYQWSGSTWIESSAVPVTVDLTDKGNLRLTSTKKGSSVVVMTLIPKPIPIGMAQVNGYGCADVSYSTLSTHSMAYYGPESCSMSIFQMQDVISALGTKTSNFLFGSGNISIAKILPQIHGFDNLSGTPSYLETGIGDDGSSDERRELANNIRMRLGYPVVEVELTKEQLDTCIRIALEHFRQKSSLGYTRGFFFVDMIPGVQKYKLSSRVNGYNKIVNVMGMYRFTSAFLSSAHGSGVYGQIVLQHLYNMGTYDLTSFHLVAQYVEQLEHLFATRLTFHWHEHTRELTVYNQFVASEKVLVEASVERSEQEIMVDRWAKTWIERWALSEAMLILAQTRGKFASLPGAGGGVSLNAADLSTRAGEEQGKLLEEIDNYVSQDVEDYGMGSQFIIG